MTWAWPRSKGNEILQNPSQVLHFGPSAREEPNRNWALTSSSHQLSYITRQHFHRKGNVRTISCCVHTRNFWPLTALLLEDSHLLFAGGAEVAVISWSCRHSQVRALGSRFPWARPQQTENTGLSFGFRASQQVISEPESPVCSSPGAHDIRNPAKKSWVSLQRRSIPSLETTTRPFGQSGCLAFFSFSLLKHCFKNIWLVWKPGA